MLISVHMGNRIFPITLARLSDKKLKVQFRYSQELVNEIKSWSGASFDSETKTWTVDDNDHNWYCIYMLRDMSDPRYDAILRLSDYSFFRPLYKHQQEMVVFGCQRKRGVIAGEPGVGKTLAAIEIMERNPCHSWIVCPKTAKIAWQLELKKWTTSLREVCNSPDNGTYKFITYDRLMDAVVKTPIEWLPQLVIFDEAHKIKNPSAQRTSAAFLLADYVRAKDGIIIPMTGTPAPHDPTDWWTLIELCQPGFFRESTKNKLKFRLGVHEDFGDFKKLAFWKKEEVEKLYLRMRGIALIKLKKDCIDIPPKIYQQINLPLDKVYKDMLSFIRMSSTSAIECLNRLRQFSDGFQYSNNEVLIETPKDEWLIDFLTEQSPERIVIYAGFHRSIDKVCSLVRSLGYAVIKVDGRGIESDVTDPFNHFQEHIGDKVVYIGQPRAGGISVTLTRADTVIYYSNDFDAAARVQSEDRIHRIGTTKATIIDLLWLPTDTLVLNNLQLKRDLQSVTMGEINEFWNTYERSVDSSLTEV